MNTYNPLLVSFDAVGAPLRVAALLEKTNAVEIMLGFILDNASTTLFADIKRLQGFLDEAFYGAALLGHFKYEPRHSRLMSLLLHAGANPFATTR